MKTFDKQYHQPGTLPGTLIRHNNHDDDHTIRTWNYDANELTEALCTDIKQTQAIEPHGLPDLYLSSLNTRMNDIMRVLTIIATIFIPLTFLIGVYGMNFKHMPELKWLFGYPLLWSIMLILAGGMLWLFRRNNWL